MFLFFFSPVCVPDSYVSIPLICFYIFIAQYFSLRRFSLHQDGLLVYELLSINLDKFVHSAVSVLIHSGGGGVTILDSFFQRVNLQPSIFEKP